MDAKLVAIVPKLAIQQGVKERKTQTIKCEGGLLKH